MRQFWAVVLVGVLGSSAVAQGGGVVVPDDLSPTQRARFERFENFRIDGVCGDRDLERLAALGVNTVRGYTIPAPEKMRAKLDEAHRHGLKMVVSEWMPHHGRNKGNDGAEWNFDYTVKGDDVVAKFIEKVEQIGDHPAILMWGLGNEVHLDEPYLRTVNRMSLAIHERFPRHITSLTMINAKPEAIEAVKRYAPDLDVLGIQSYSPGAVRNAIKQTEELWGKPFYMSEFNGKGPWNFGKSAWGVPLDEPVPQKVADLAACYDAIESSPLCLGSTIFVWGHHGVFRPTYFSLLLDPDPTGPGPNGPLEELLVTPQAELMIERFTGRPMRDNRAPVLTALAFTGGEQSRTATPGEPVRVSLAAHDPDGDPVELVAWLLDSSQRVPQPVAGPIVAQSDTVCVIQAPQEPGEYLVMVYAMDGKGGGSASTLPLKVQAK